MNETICLKNGLEVRLRPSCPDDAAGLVALEMVLAVRGDGMVVTPEQVRTVDQERARLVEHARTASPAALGLVALHPADGPDQAIVAEAELRELGPARVRHVGLISLGIHPTMHRAGLGRALMTALVDHGRANGLLRLELYVRADNAAALALYRGMGFVCEGTRTKFVRLDDGTFVDDHVFAMLL